ncbi:MAG: protein of unknown function (DUF4395) [Chloroflexi bacterium]|jgi:hypothetical protein|nr:MAG: protein of unknown function (DUF4395) [Chloroflexota bacterium]
MIREIFSFPHPVDEVAARTVAGCVVVLVGATILFEISILMWFIAYGFLARVLTGPSHSPIGLLATKVLVPMMGIRPRLVPGPPKRFAQSIGLALSVLALIFYYVFGLQVAAYSLLAVVLFFATLELVIGFCMGCFVFGRLMELGLIPKTICDKCNDLGFSRAESR